MTTFAQLIHGIGVQESGNNYSVVNSIGAVGKYQVMKANIPSWSREILGYSITWQQFRNSPSLQEKIVQGKLRKYYNKYGAAGAAAMWYSGQPNPNKTYGNPPVYKYVNSVIGIANKYKSNALPGGGSSSLSNSKGGGSSTSSAPKERVLSKAELAENYGFVDALFNSNKELKSLFAKAVKGQWTADKFQAELRDTKWWKTHSKTEREYLTKKYGDPASVKQEESQAYIKVRQLANQLGMKETPGNKKLLNTWAYNVIAKGWDENQLRYEIGKRVFFGDDVHQGEGGEAQDKLREYAYSMGVTKSSQWYADKSRNIVRGIATQQDYEDEIRRTAKAQFSFWSKQIDAGQTVSDLASPYMQSMANILELPAGSINLFDPTIKKALQNKDKLTGKAEVKPMWQFENDLRSDSRWKSTKNAQDSMMQVAHQILTDYGVKY